jgi:SAM-dependent methyltransferase
MADDLKGRAPGHGVDCSAEYVESYRRTHLHPEDLEYRLSYYRIVLLDGLLRDYSYLDAGCGTAGYFRLMRNARRLTGVDYSERMIATAQDFSVRNGYAGKTRFVCSDFSAFESDETYDAIRLGVYGSYLPVSVPVLKKAHAMLRPGGFLLIGITLPQGFRGRLRDRLGLASTRISGRRFEQLVREAGGLSILTATRVRHRMHYLLRSGGGENGT